MSPQARLLVPFYHWFCTDRLADPAEIAAEEYKERDCKCAHIFISPSKVEEVLAEEREAMGQEPDDYESPI